MIILIMGVTGAGKTTIGTLLAQQLGWEFADADSLHSAANVEKMRLDIPLTDADRIPWLEAIHQALAEWTRAGKNGVLACSALKESYRQILCRDLEVKLVYLRGNFQLIAGRVAQRHGHYAHAGLVVSQFEALEEPKDALIVEVNHTPPEIVAGILQKLHLS